MKNLARYVLSITLSVILVFSAIPSVVVHADDNQALQGAGKHPISKTPEGWYDLREVLLMFLENSFKNTKLNKYKIITFIITRFVDYIFSKYLNQCWVCILNIQGK